MAPAASLLKNVLGRPSSALLERLTGRRHPSYEQRLLTNDERARLSLVGDLRSLFLFFLYNAVCLATSIFLRVRYFTQFRTIDRSFMKYQDAFG